MLEADVPTRAEVAEILKSVTPRKGSKGEKKIRNQNRLAKIKEAYPVEVFNLIESDLPSYPEWEIEADDEA